MSRNWATSFTKGEISPEMGSRFDLATYQNALKEAYNVKIRRAGGITKRMGTRFVVEALSNPSRLIPFQFSDDQAYALEFSQATMRPLALGGAVLEAGLVVTAITKAANALITASNHGYSVGDQVYLLDIVGMVEIIGRVLTVLTVPTANTFTVNINSTNFTTFAGSGGGVTNVVTPPPAPVPPVVPPVYIPPAPPPIASSSGGTYKYDVGSGRPAYDGDRGRTQIP